MAGAERSPGALERRSPSLLRLSSAVIVLAVGFVAAGCGNDTTIPTTLFDGSRIRQPPVPLENASTPSVLTKVLVTDARRVAPRSSEASCIARQADGLRPFGAVVTRVAVSGESVTFRERSGVAGCDRAGAGDAGRRGWCGGSYGRTFRGHLRDPRLDVAGCRTAAGEAAAFAWVEPGRDARYVVVAQRGYSEVYPVVRGVPVRIATEIGIDADPIAAAFDVSEHDDDGRLLRRYRLTAQPSG